MADSDIVWDGEFSEIMAINSKGIRVIDHSKLDTLSVFRSAAHVPRAILRMRNLVRLSKSGGWVLDCGFGLFGLNGKFFWAYTSVCLYRAVLSSEALNHLGLSGVGFCYPRYNQGRMSW